MGRTHTGNKKNTITGLSVLILQAVHGQPLHSEYFNQAVYNKCHSKASHDKHVVSKGSTNTKTNKLKTHPGSIFAVLYIPKGSEYIL